MARNCRAELTGIVQVAGETRTLNSGPAYSKKSRCESLLASDGVEVSFSPVRGNVQRHSGSRAVEPLLFRAVHAVGCEPIIFFLRQNQECFAKGPLDWPRNVSRLLFSSAACCCRRTTSTSAASNSPSDSEERGQSFIVNDPHPRTRREIEERCVNDTLKIAGCPWRPLQHIDTRYAFQHARTRSIQADMVFGARLGDVQLDVDFTVLRNRRGQMVEQLSVQGARFDRIFDCEPVDRRCEFPLPIDEFDRATPMPGTTAASRR